jgi:hypothetical protein
MPFEHSVSAGWDRASRADSQATISYFKHLLSQYPDDPGAMFELARALDWGGQPDKASPMYEQAFASGLDGDRLRRGMLQYGSTLRNLGVSIHGSG